MTLRLYMDQHVPRAVTAGLRLRGIDILAAEEDGTATLPDPALLDRATELGRVLFTQDRDFLAECTRRQAEGRPFGGVIYAHQLLVPIGRCIADLELIALAGAPDDLQDMVLYLPL